MQIRDFLEGRLDVDVAPASLFGVAISDDQAVDVEAARLAAMLQEIESAAKSGSAKGARAARQLRLRSTLADGGSSYLELRPVDPELWAARVELDRTTLQYLGLPKERREDLLATHAERLAAAARARAERPLSEEERSVKEAEIERQNVLEEARLARADAQHRVTEERNRLLGIQNAQKKFESAIAKRRQDLAERRDLIVGWQRRATEARQQRESAAGDVDEIYDDLRRTLRSARNELAAALEETGEPSAVPSAGRDPLATLSVDVDTSLAAKERKAVEVEAQRLREQEHDFREHRVTQLLDEIHTLNEERLSLQPFLTAEKRDAITGFGAAGVDQAASEVRQLTLVLRYHRHATGNWVASLRRPGQAFGPSVARGAFIFFEWLLVIGIFVGWRRRAPAILENVRERVEQRDREARRSEPTILLQAITFLQQVRRPFEWLVLLAALDWLIPAKGRELLEVQLLLIIFRWSFIGSLVVNALNAVAGASALGALRPGARDASTLRLRSLRLVGRVVVVLGLVLVISARLVGKGTLYQWVWSTCWIASIPVFLVLVRWWREIVFVRTESVRKKSAFEKWLLEHRTGWKSFPAAMVGGVYLFVYGAWRSARNWIGRFDVTRRVLAYLFRRKLDKLVEEQTLLQIEPLSVELFQALGPDRISAKWIVTDVDGRLDTVVSRLRAKRGGIIAVIGERGMGKSHFLRRVREQVPEALGLDLGPIRNADLLRTFVEQLGLTEEMTLRGAAGRLDKGEDGPGVLVDGAERFVRPTMGGLADFDQLLDAARSNSARFTWVLAFDHVIWQFLERARGARPLFDEVIRLARWREEEIAQLLRERTEGAGIVPKFDPLLERMPANADEIDRQEALLRREASYHRLIWDHAGGNPGVALHTWRRSLGVGRDGETYVKLLQALDPRDLEMLPDSAVFVLRAVLQLTPASRDAICRATMLRSAQVEDALRYAVGRGYVTEEGGTYVASWTWFRPITRFLQRRHLLLAQ